MLNQSWCLRSNVRRGLLAHQVIIIKGNKVHTFVHPERTCVSVQCGLTQPSALQEASARE